MSETPKGFEPIEIDGIPCYIGWTDGEDDAYWAVVRHGCQIGKGHDRERAITDALGSLTEPGTWLRGPNPQAACCYEGYEPITIDGIDCQIGWTNTDYSTDEYADYEEHWAVLRHGCEIGKSPDRDMAIAEALRTLRHKPSEWLRGPKPF